MEMRGEGSLAGRDAWKFGEVKDEGKEGRQAGEKLSAAGNRIRDKPESNA